MSGKARLMSPPEEFDRRRGESGSACGHSCTIEPEDLAGLHVYRPPFPLIQRPIKFV